LPLIFLNYFWREVKKNIITICAILKTKHADSMDIEKKYCPFCGRENPVTYRNCGECGYELPKVSFSEPKKNRQPQSDRDVEAQSYKAIRSSNNTKRILGYGFIFAIIGFVVGYFIFAKQFIIGWLSIKEFFAFTSGNILVSALDNALFKSIRHKIFISSAIGGIVGVIVALIINKKK